MGLCLRLALLLAASPVHAFELPDLMALLATHTSGQARFSEQRFVKGFDAPLTSSGTLSFSAPDQFIRRTLEPRAESLAVDGNQLTLTRNGRSRSVALDAAPEAAAAVEAIRGTLTGNAAALQREFDIGVAGDAERWTLTLTPRDARAAASLASVRLVGRRDAVQSVETRLADGDRALMTIMPLPASAATP